MSCYDMDEGIEQPSMIQYTISHTKSVDAEGVATAQVTDTLISVQVDAIAIDSGDTINLHINETYPVDSIVAIADSETIKLICPWCVYTRYKSGDCTILKSDYTAQVDQIRLSVSCKTKESYWFIVYGTLLH